MDEELIIIGVEEAIDSKVSTEDIEQNVEEEEILEYVEIEDVEEIDIALEEGTGWVGGDSTKHYSLYGRDEANQHPIEAITGLRDELDFLASTSIKKGKETIYHDHYSVRGGYAEFREWAKGGYYEKNIRGKDELGYFVSLINPDGNAYIEICQAQDSAPSDVYGVTVANSAICGRQNEEYSIFDTTTDKANSTNPLYVRVCLLGTVTVRFGGTQEQFDKLKIGSYVIPDEKGCAKPSANNIGFKVILKHVSGAGELWNGLTIALVPQNDNVARVMKELEKTNEGVSTIIGQLGTLEETVNNNISISGDFEDLEEAFGKLESNVNTKFEIAETTYKTAQEISDEATKAMESMTTNYNEAMDKVSMDISNIHTTLDDIGKYDLDIITEYGNSIAGFFSETSDDKVTIGTIAKSLDEANSNLSMIKQSSNAIQHLVCSVDVYSVGYQSPTDGLSYVGANNTLGTYEYIYVPIAKIYGETNNIEKSPIYICNSDLEKETWYGFEIDSIAYYFQPQGSYEPAKLEFNKTTKQLTIDGEKVNTYNILEEDKAFTTLEFESEKITYFEEGYSYKWQQYGEYDNEFWWVKDLKVSFDANNPPSEGYELWYTRSGVPVDETLTEYVYSPGTLYRLIDGLWVAVATINDNNARTMSLINQTADSLTSTITNVAGEVSALEQTAKGFSTRVADVEGNLSEINQTAENIRLGKYEPGGGQSELELLLSGMSSTAIEAGSVKVCEILDTSPSATKYYDTKPNWNGKKFEFGGKVVEKAVGTYCEGEKPNTYYEITENGYIVYTNGNTAMASLNTRVDKNESAIESWTQFETEFSETMTGISQGSTKDVSELIAMTLGAFTHKTESVIDLTEEQLAALELENGVRYSKKPEWDIELEIFSSIEQANDGKYFIPEDGKCYYVLRLDGSDIVGYEKYELKSSQYASVVQKVEDGKSYIGLVAESDESMGSIVARTINDRSEVLIEADKITLNGTTTFADTLNPEKTAISGDYIRTGVITSNNYSGPVINRMYGMSIALIDTYRVSGDVVFSFTSGVTDYQFPDGFSMGEGYGLIGVDLGIASRTYYYLYHDSAYILQVDNLKGYNKDTGYFTVHRYKLDQLHIPDGEIVNVYADLELEEDVPQLVRSDVSKCVYYTPIVNGKLSITDDYYYASNIDVDAVLFSERQETGIYDKSQYIVSEVDFDLVPSDIEIEGMKFDLDNGTIYSNNLILDRYGDLSITGKISATSGYIGDDANGFTIYKNGGYYALINMQNSFLGRDNGANYGDPGIYISPQGIGMGHGRFEAPNTGYYFRVAGIRLHFMNKFKFGNCTYPICAIDSSTSDSRGLSFGEYDDLIDNYSYSSMLLEPRSMSTTSCNAKLHLWGQVVTYSNNAISELSDARLKTNIVDTNINAIETIKKIETKSFDWINSGEHVDVGLIAQQVEQVSPSLVLTNEETGLKSINTTKLIPYLIKAVQELSEIVCPSVSLLSLDEESTSETHWVDDMSDEEKQYYVELAMAPRYKIKD